MLCRSLGVRPSCRPPAAATLRFSLTCLVSFLLLAPATGQSSPDKLKVRIVSSQFRDVPLPLVKLAIHPLQALVRVETGLKSEFQLAKDADELADLLATDKVHLGVFHGVEFAWVRQKYPDLRPLVIAVNQQRHLRAHLMVAKDSEAGQFADLRGKSLALARYTRLHCRLFVESPCREAGQEPDKFFSRISQPANVEDALDDVVDGTVHAAVVDGIALECYRRRKPGRFAKLRELCKSEVFPSSVIAYRPGVLDEATLKRFRDGLIQASQKAASRQVLMLWKMTNFEAIPDDYEQTLTDIAKAYPQRREGK